jgi:hypothetical protein
MTPASNNNGRDQFGDFLLHELLTGVIINS